MKLLVDNSLHKKVLCFNPDDFSISNSEPGKWSVTMAMSLSTDIRHWCITNLGYAPSIRQEQEGLFLIFERDEDAIMFLLKV